jgi:hypothetical protein
MKLGQQSSLQLMSMAKKIDGSEEKMNTLFARMFFFSRVRCSIYPFSSTNSHDMNIQRTRLNRSNGHSLPLPLFR